MAVGVGEAVISLRAVDVEKLNTTATLFSLGENLHHEREISPLQIGFSELPETLVYYQHGHHEY